METNYQEKEDCIWYLLSLNKDSTTFEARNKIDIKEIQESKIYKCMCCDGYNPACKDYVSSDNMTVWDGKNSLENLMK